MRKYEERAGGIMKKPLAQVTDLLRWEKKV
jgi:hypothetical protein